MHKEGIAIVGIGCRFPGGVNDAEALWKLLVDGREAICETPPDRWNLERFYDAEPGVISKSIARRGGFIEGIDQFDPQFFGISPREAPHVDPQHRLLLETAWEAMEDAGIVLDLERGTDLATFVGISHNDYQIIQGTPWDSSGITPHSPTGTAHSIAANRISYCFNLRGPSVALDTACSSALTAVHLACEHIWSGRGETALAAGVTVMITPGGFIGFSQASMLSPDGRCKAFDASANGFVRGEGAGAVILKRLSQAIEDGDSIHAVIVGSAINQDGHTNGISLPSAEAQARLVSEACRDAGIDPSQIGFVEAHGTGTAVGDPIEAHALAEALCKDRAADAPLAIGSVKTNLGHLETAAGIAGLVKAALVLKHGQIPASLHFEKPNPHIDFEGLKIRVPVELEEFPDKRRTSDGGRQFFRFRRLERTRDSGRAAAIAAGRYRWRRRTRLAGRRICPLGRISARLGVAPGGVVGSKEKLQWQLAGSARFDLYPWRQAQPPPASPDAGRAHPGRGDPGAECICAGPAGTENQELLLATTGTPATHRFCPERSGTTMVGNGT